MQTVSIYDPLFEPWRRATPLKDLMRDSAHVVNVHSRLIAEATANPLQGDYAEPGQIIPEKATAFSKAAIAMSAKISVVQTGLMASWIEMLGSHFRRARWPYLRNGGFECLRKSADPHR
jgi:hypothetical protein